MCPNFCNKSADLSAEKPINKGCPALTCTHKAVIIIRVSGVRVWGWEEGWGPTFYLPLAWDGASRHTASIVEAAADENQAAARADLLAGLGLDAEAFLAITEGGGWFARRDPPHNAGSRPATAAPRKRPT